MFRVRGPHERRLLGVATAKCDAPGAPYTVLLADHRVFQDTGLAPLGLFGTQGLNAGGGCRFNGGASGHEIDTSFDADAQQLPCEITSTLPVLRSPAPPNLALLAIGQNGLGAHMTFYRHRGGGFVFSAGSITFGGSLVYGGSLANTPIQRIVRNVMDMK
jgi:hypothetical protein